MTFITVRSQQSVVNKYTGVAEGTSFTPNKDSGYQAPRFFRLTDGIAVWNGVTAIAPYKAPDGRLVIIGGDLYIVPRTYGAGWWVDGAELVVDDTKPGSYFIDQYREPGVAFYIEIPDDWVKV